MLGNSFLSNARWSNEVRGIGTSSSGRHPLPYFTVSVVCGEHSSNFSSRSLSSLTEILAVTTSSKYAVPLLVTRSNERHLCMLFIERKEDASLSVHFFDPRGSDCTLKAQGPFQNFYRNPSDFYNNVRTLVRKSFCASKLNRKFRYYEPANFLPALGLQTLMQNTHNNFGDGYCSFYSWHFAVYCLRNGVSGYTALMESLSQDAFAFQPEIEIQKLIDDTDIFFSR
jgi:hypothetical protein